MSQVSALQSNNNEIETVLKSNTQNKDNIKSLIKKNKIIVYSVDDISKES